MDLPNVDHVFLPGHRIMVQVQSSLFPLYDRNPQTFVPNIFYAKPGDYRKATQSVFRGGATPSAVHAADRPSRRRGTPLRARPFFHLKRVGGSMADDREIEEKFWSELKGSPFVMLGVEGTRDGATQPMTANFEDQDRDARRAVVLHRQGP